MIKTASAAVAAFLATVAPAAADQVSMALATVPVIEKLASIPIVLLDRHDDDPAEFWYQAMQRLCQKTGDNWCEDEVQVLQDTTNQIGWSRILAYRNDAGVEKKVCVVLPPRRGINAGYVATGLSAGGVYGASELPDNAATEAWILMMHVATCGATIGDDRDMRRSDAFATLALTLMEGDPGFVDGSSMTTARHFAKYRNSASSRWAVNVGERILTDLWKDEAAAALKAGGCRVSVTASSDLNTDYVSRDGSLPQGRDCTDGSSQTPPVVRSPQGTVSDQNLWIWTSGSYRGGSPVVGLPPRPYSPFKTFASFNDGVAYAWRTADSLASQ